MTAAVGFVRRGEFAGEEFIDRFVGIAFDSHQSGNPRRRQRPERAWTDATADYGVYTAHHKPETYGFMTAAFCFGDVAGNDFVVFDRVNLKLRCFAEMFEYVIVFDRYCYRNVHDVSSVGCSALL